MKYYKDFIIYNVGFLTFLIASFITLNPITTAISIGFIWLFGISGIVGWYLSSLKTQEGDIFRKHVRGAYHKAEVSKAISIFDTIYDMSVIGLLLYYNWYYMAIVYTVHVISLFEIKRNINKKTV